MSESRTDRYAPPSDLLSAVAHGAIGDWHFDFPTRSCRHGSFTDSTALTHCICWGSMFRTLVYLHEHPELAVRLLPEGYVRCTGAADCQASRHIHGCYADFGACDTPEEHRS